MKIFSIKKFYLKTPKYILYNNLGRKKSKSDWESGSAYEDKNSGEESSDDYDSEDKPKPSSSKSKLKILNDLL